MPVVPWVKKQRPVRREGARRALRARRRRRDARAEECRRRRRAQPDEQPEARRRHRAGRADAGARRQRRHRHRRRRRRTTTSTCSRRRGWRRCWPRASAAIRRRFRRATALAMATRLGARAMHIGSPDRIARARQARRPDRARPRSRCTTCRRSPAIPNGDLRADRLRREIDRRRRRDVQRPVADARPRAADARRRRAAARGGATSRARIDALPQQPRSRACCRSWSPSAARSSRRASRCRSRRASRPPTPVLAVLAGDELTVIRSQPLPPVRHLLVVRRSGPGPAALPRGRVPRRGRQGDGRAVAADADRADARGPRSATVLLFRSRYLAPATHSARFYREYFRPAAERVVEKDRRRWLVAYRGVEFYVHLDRLLNAGGRRLLPRGEVADLVAARRARQGGDHHRAARALRRTARTTRSTTATSGSRREAEAGRAFAGCPRRLAPP